jgi:hypothetical protein
MSSRILSPNPDPGDNYRPLPIIQDGRFWEWAKDKYSRYISTRRE